jgi:alkyldihydroxyacetonephosphate synthase
VLAIAGFEGEGPRCAAVFAETGRVMQAAGGVPLGAGPGASWHKSRYDLPYLRESLLRRGIGVDTFETVAPWSRLAELKLAASAAFERAMAATLDGNRRGALMCHLSHSYPEGACLYFTALFPQAKDRLGQWRMVKSEISNAISASGGAASHHHGVGSDHAAMARLEKGGIGLDLLRALKNAFDPENLMVSGMGRMLG